MVKKGRGKKIVRYFPFNLFPFFPRRKVLFYLGFLAL